MQLRLRLLSTILVVLVLQIAQVIPTDAHSNCERPVTIPNRSRTEGRLTLSYRQDGQTIKHHLAFSETLDYVAEKGAITIGYVSYSPNKYFSRKGVPTIWVAGDGNCNTIPVATFLPEISWFVERVFPNTDTRKFLETAPHMIGPSGVIYLLNRMNDGRSKLKYERPAIHRNIPCNVESRTFELRGAKLSVKHEVFIPVAPMLFRNLKNVYFTVKATISRDESTDSSAGPSWNELGQLTIDFFNIEKLADDPALELLNLHRADFNLPLGTTCSEHLAKIKPEFKSESFAISYSQSTYLNSLFVAYDHKSALLRKEVLGSSVTIWDIYKHLMYYVDSGIGLRLPRQTSYRSCSVLHVFDMTLAKPFRPYNVNGIPFLMDTVMGATEVAYMGRGYVRDLPCRIYETVVKEPPMFFLLAGDEPDRKAGEKAQYIVQFYLLDGSTKQSIDPEKSLTVENFLPAKINLFESLTDGSAPVKLIDSIDIHEFSWSLDGQALKRTELFMVPECFDDEDEQLRLEMAIAFDDIHNGARSRELQILMANNKFRTEVEVIDRVMYLADVDKMHLVEYEMQMHPHHLSFEMLIGDRREHLDLVPFGEGFLLESTKDKQVEFSVASEQLCVATSALLPDATLAAFCRGTDTEPARCIALINEREPTLSTKGSAQQPGQPPCRTYLFTASPSSDKGAYKLIERERMLTDAKFHVEATKPNSGGQIEILKGKVIEHEVLQSVKLLNIAHYRFVLDETDSAQNGQKAADNQQLVRAFNSIMYKNEGDCAKMCNLDAHCRSYSYCSMRDDNGNDKHPACLISSLDLRASKVEDQLVHAAVKVAQASTFRVPVKGENNEQYSLEFVDHCDIRERDYLSMFSQTDEEISVSSDIVQQFYEAGTAFECAKHSVDVESASSKHHIAMFAYCGQTHSCLLDESIFGSPKSVARDRTEGDEKDESRDEVDCRLYRKKYQTFFQVSTQVHKLQSEKQISLEVNTVESCARACWNQFGQVCSSFDFCGSAGCLINQRASESDELEVRSGCLHYERDLTLDRLRQEHAIGRHTPLAPKESPLSVGRIVWNCVTYALVLGAFVYGLVVGRQVNDKLESVTIMRQSISAGAGMRASSVFGNSFGGSFENEDDDDDKAGSARTGAMTDDIRDPNAIPLGVIRRPSSSALSNLVDAK